MRDILFTLEDMLKQRRAEVEQGVADVDERTRHARSSWWKRFIDTAFGERDSRENERRELAAELTIANDSLRQLADRSSSVSPHAEYARVRPWN
jgi:hypothetical protein